MAKKKYFEEFGRDAVELSRSVMRTVITRIAADLGITDATWSAWIKAAGVPVRHGRRGTARRRSVSPGRRTGEPFCSSLPNHRDTFEVKWLRQIVQVSPSSFYALLDGADARATLTMTLWPSGFEPRTTPIGLTARRGSPPNSTTPRCLG